MSESSRLGAMEGGGFYAAHSDPQRAYGELGIGWLEEAARAVEPPGSGPLVIADMGAAGGGNSLEPLRRAIEAYRERDPGRAVLSVHTDIPSNDFSALFELVDSSPESYARLPDVYPSGIGRSFYERLLPDGMLSLGWSSIAVHWLSSVPQPIPDQIYSTFATGGVRNALRERSARDWESFLSARAAELHPSGGMVVIGGAARDDGSSEAEGLMRIANDALLSLVDAGTLDATEYERMTIPTWNRTLAEFVEPFDTGGAAKELELRRAEPRVLEDAYHERLAADGDVDAYVEAQAGFFRAAFEPSLWASLDAKRTEDERDAIESAFGVAIRSGIAADPDAAACRWHVVVLDIARRV